MVSIFFKLFFVSKQYFVIYYCNNITFDSSCQKKNPQQQMNAWKKYPVSNNPPELQMKKWIDSVESLF